MSETRKTAYHIKPEFTERWSPRAFGQEEISHEILRRGCEAARWAPSGGNSQPARFLFARRASPAFAAYASFLAEGNRSWAKEAAALVILLGRKDFVSNGKRIESTSVAFDCGSAWMSFALQMTAEGWFTHAMGGFDRERVRRDLGVPDNHTVEVMIAVGRLGAREALPEPLRAREAPSPRHPSDALVAEDAVPDSWRE